MGSTSKNVLHAHLSQRLEHRRPSPSRNFGGRHGQPFAAPCGMPKAGGGLVVEGQLGEIGVAQDAGDEVASNRDRYVVVAL